MADVRVDLHLDAIDRLRALDQMRDELLLDAVPLITAARVAAPHDTGAGAASIHAEAILDGDEWLAHVGWDRHHFYMKFHELGSRELPPRPFLVPATKGAAR